MHYPNQGQGYTIQVTFLTKARTLYNEKVNSKTTFEELLENFKKNPKYKNQVQPKDKYLINGKFVRNDQTLESIFSQNMLDPLSSEICIELDDLIYSGDANSPIYKKILQPKINPFGLYVYSPRDSILELRNFPEKTIDLFELNKINEGSAYCNSKEDLYISGGKDKDNKNFWIINNGDYSIKKKTMPCEKQNHSMIYLNFNENDEWVFIAGGDNRTCFYYDLNKKYFIDWGITFGLYQNPALIQLGEYLYIFDTLNDKKDYFERTKIISPTRKWERIFPKIDKEIIDNFPSEFAISYDIKGNAIFLGGNNIINSKSSYIYNPTNNKITLSQNGINENILFSDKSFYKVTNKYSVALPKNIEESKVICVFDKNEQTLMKIDIDIPQEKNKIRINSKISLIEKKNVSSKKDEGIITIKIKENKGKRINDNVCRNNNIQQQIICNSCINNIPICQVCHKTLNNDNNLPNQPHTFPYSEKIHDQYYPTLDKNYELGKTKYNDKVKVQVIYDEYTPLKFDYEIGKPYVFKINKNVKKEEPIKSIEENIINNEQEKEVNNEQEKEIIQENQNQNIQNEENNIEENQENKEVVENNIDNVEKHHEEQEQQEKLEPYINEEENAEQENEENIEEQQYEEEHYENSIEEKVEEYNEQNEEEHDQYKHYAQKDLEAKPQHEIMVDSLEANDIKKDSENVKVIKKVTNEDNEKITPMFKLNFGIEEDSDKSDDNNDIVKGLNVNFDGEKEDKNCIISCNKSNEVKENNIPNNENQDNAIITNEEHREQENQNLEENNYNGEEHLEEENNYHENEENVMEVEEHHQDGNEMNFSENGGEMEYEGEEEQYYEEGQNDPNEIEQEGENENEEHHQEDNGGEFEEENN